MLNKLIAGSAERKTRLHDQKGNLISASRLLRNAPQASISGAARLLFGARPARPWISYDAQQALAKLLRPDFRALEFGSGMSTLWYAARTRQVVSIEHYEPWYRKVRELLTARGVANVDYRLAPAKEDYLAIPSKDEGFDFIMVDGQHRPDCVIASLPTLRKGGILYLDNSDRGGENGAADYRATEALLADYARSEGATITYYTDFAPTQLFVQEGLMLVRPRASQG